MKDLFGNEITEEEYLAGGAVVTEQGNMTHHNGSRQQWKKDHHYRLALTKEKRCGTCAALRAIHGRGKTYYKCLHLGDSRSTATDIRLRDLCDAWAQRPADEPVKGFYL